MPAVRYRGYFNSIGTTGLNSTEWRVDILEDGYVGSVTEVTMAAPGLEIQRETDGDMLFENPIRSSRCTAFFMVQDGTFKAWLEGIATANENEYFIAVYKKVSGNFVRWWTGMVLHDLCEFDDQPYPYTFSLTATDGLERLGEIEFDYAANSSNPASVVLGDAIVEALKYNNIHTCYSLLEAFVSSSVNWADENHTTLPDTLAATRANRLTLLQNPNPFDGDANLKGKTCREVIEAILRPFGARIEMNRGVYRIFCLTNYGSAPTTITEKRYTYNGFSTGFFDTITPDVQDDLTQAARPSKLAGGTYTYRPELQRVTIRYPRLIAQAMQRTYAAASATTWTIDDFTGQDTYSMRITGVVEVPAQALIFKHARLSWTITCGAYRCKPDATGELAWSIGIGSQFHTPFPVTKSPTGRCLVDFDMRLPKVPGSLATTDISIVAEAAFYFGPYSSGAPTGSTGWTACAWGFQGQIQQGQSTTEEKYILDRTAVVTGANTGNSYQLQLDTIFTEADSKHVFNGLEVYNGMTWGRSLGWAVGAVPGAGTGKKLNLLLGEQAIGYQQPARKVYRGSIIGDYDSHISLLASGELYIFNAGRFVAQDDRWEGEWILFSYDGSGLNSTDEEVNPWESKADADGKVMAVMREQLAALNNRVGDPFGYVLDAIINNTTDMPSPVDLTQRAITIKYDGTAGAWTFEAETLAAGTVTSVGMTAPSQFAVTGSPVTGAGTLALAWNNQSANTILAAPDGSTGAPTFRALVAADIPNLDAGKITTGTIATARLGSGTANSTTFLRGDGTWATPSGGSGVTTIGSIDGVAKSANGAAISGSTLHMQTADATNPGLVSTGSQTFAGNKTFSGTTFTLSASGVILNLSNVTATTAGIQFGGNWALRRTDVSSGASNCIILGAGANGTFTGHSNIIIGDSASTSLSSGVRNVVIGQAAGQTLSTGTDNMYIGKDAAKLATSGYSNVAIGSNALYNAGSKNNNVALGDSAAYAIDGGANVYIGASSGYNSGGATKAAIGNVSIGYQSGFQNAGDYNVFLGYQAGYQETTSSNTLVIANTFNDYLIKGNFSTYLVIIKNRLSIDPRSSDPGTPVNGEIWYRSSNERLLINQNGTTREIVTTDGTLGTAASAAGAIRIRVNGANYDILYK